MEKLYKNLSDNITRVTTECISSKNSYERKLSSTFDFEVQNERYWDAVCKKSGLYLEFKKCTGMMWFDQVRYVEIKKKMNGKAATKTYTLIFFYSKSSKYRNIITQIAILDTDKLIEKLFTGYPDQLLDAIIQNYKLTPRGLNSQASLNKKDILKLADRVIEHPKFTEENVRANMKRLMKEIKSLKLTKFV